MRKPAVKFMAIAMLLLVPLTGCQTVSDNPKTAIGGLGGAATGGLIAAAAGGGGAGIAAGVIGGALLGGLVGNLLDQRDKELQAKAASQACEYQQTVTIDGKKENSFGTACRQPDGSWRIVN
jgi:surface antigen